MFVCIDRHIYLYIHIHQYMSLSNLKKKMYVRLKNIFYSISLKIETIKCAYQIMNKNLNHTEVLKMKQPRKEIKKQNIL